MWLPFTSTRKDLLVKRQDLQVNHVPQCMTKNRYLDIKKNSHFNDNSLLLSQDNPKRSFKIALLHVELYEKYLQIGTFCNELSIDD